jgi:hypothetical protein
LFVVTPICTDTGGEGKSIGATSIESGIGVVTLTVATATFGTVGFTTGATTFVVDDDAVVFTEGKTNIMVFFLLAPQQLQQRPFYLNLSINK